MARVAGQRNPTINTRAVRIGSNATSASISTGMQHSFQHSNRIRVNGKAPTPNFMDTKFHPLYAIVPASTKNGSKYSRADITL